MNGEEYYGFPMTREYCDSCLREIRDLPSVIVSGPYKSPIYQLEFCLHCFDKHWKLGSKRFSLKKFMNQLTRNNG